VAFLASGSEVVGILVELRGPEGTPEGKAMMYKDSDTPVTMHRTVKLTTATTRQARDVQHRTFPPLSVHKYSEKFKVYCIRYDCIQ